ncbi:GAF domain-containing sensor histidine kinase [Magnetococcus sp. PR-3]|uniref:GAF domain-containing sensor histidine kinase n=1 Tax=Magnetococcus sp. PR-3 TaxID=3120355 RepID=UPI002FCE6606
MPDQIVPIHPAGGIDSDFLDGMSVGTLTVQLVDHGMDLHMTLTGWNPAFKKLFSNHLIGEETQEPEEILPGIWNRYLRDAVVQQWKQQSTKETSEFIQLIEDRRLHFQLFNLNPAHVGITVVDLLEIEQTALQNQALLQARLDLHQQTERALRLKIEEVEKGQRLQEVIFNITKLSLTSKPLEEILKQSLKMLLMLPEFNVLPKGVILLANEKAKQLELVASQGIESTPVAQICATVPYGSCLCGRVALAKEDVSISTDSRLESGHDVQFEGMELHGHVHIKILGQGGKMVGVITLYLQPGYTPSDQEISMLRTMANTMAGVVERKHAEEAAEAAAAAKQEFLANIGHELRTPLHGILGFAERGVKRLDRGELAADKLTRYYKNILKGGQRLLLLLNDLLDLSKLEAGRMQFNLAWHDLNQLMLDVCEEFQPLIEAKNIQVKCGSQLEDGQVMMDSMRIQQLLSNLLSNAIKFTPEEGLIELNLRHIEMRGGRRANDPEMVHGIELTVEDSGMGIPDGELEAIFDKFAQSTRTNTGAGGTGLGLAICREIATNHVGTIHAENRDGGGARLVFALPRGSDRRHDEPVTHDIERVE